MGHDYAPGKETVRFRAHPSLRFPGNPIVELSHGETDENGDTRPPSMSVSFMGLTGSSGALPLHYTEQLIGRVRERDRALSEFLDLFNHRTISLFYRAWEKYRFAIVHERVRLADVAPDNDDLFTQCLLCLVGMGTPGLDGRLEVANETFTYYAGHFSRRPSSAVSLELILSDYLGMHLSVNQFQGQWLYLAEHDRSALPTAAHPAPPNCRLGVDVIVGERVWDVQSKFRIRISPMSYRQFTELMPSGKALRPLVELVRTYVGPDRDFDVQPLLNAREVPPCRMRADDPQGARLGWNTWVCSDVPTHDKEDATFFLNDV